MVVEALNIVIPHIQDINMYAHSESFYKDPTDFYTKYIIFDI